MITFQKMESSKIEFSPHLGAYLTSVGRKFPNAGAEKVLSRDPTSRNSLADRLCCHPLPDQVGRGDVIGQSWLHR